MLEVVVASLPACEAVQLQRVSMCAALCTAEQRLPVLSCLQACAFLRAKQVCSTLQATVFKQAHCEPLPGSGSGASGAPLLLVMN